MDNWGGLSGRLGLVLASAAIIAVPARAGDTPLYQEIPAWVIPAQMPDVTRPSRHSTLIFDQQQRIEEGRLWAYQDFATRIDNPQELTQAGTIAASWLPDKGDLVVHGVTIVRDGEEINVLDGGTRFEVIRREQQLEQRIINGLLTATLAVPGLRVGDVLRVSYSTSLSDQALDKEVQSVIFLPREPGFAAQQGRLIVSWPQDADVHWKAPRDVALPDPVRAGDVMSLTIELPLGRSDEMPGDAPLRYHQPALLQVGTFSGWQELSAVVAPHFATEALILQDGPIQAEVAAIMASHASDQARALAALQLAQDRISYLLNGLDGGNYIPQSPAQTWELRYGDCKAKTLLLLSMLREMGIESEAVLVRSAAGDALPEMLPMAADFDHVLVRARIDGQDFWLDGTASGATARTIKNVPPFHYGLPLRPAGAQLEPITMRAPSYPEMVVNLQLDQRAGGDLPALFEGEWILSGALVQQIGSFVDELGKDQRRQFVTGMTSSQTGPSELVEFDIVPDEENSSLIITASGIVHPGWVFRGAQGEQTFHLMSNLVNFQPDRARRKWQDIPAVIPGPAWSQLNLNILLPEAGESYDLSGPRDLAISTAGIQIERQVTLSDKAIGIFEEIKLAGGEVAPADIAETKRQLAPLVQNELKLSAPGSIARKWRYAGGADRSLLKQLDAAFAALIDADPDNNNHRGYRGLFRFSTHDYDGALEDATRFVEEEPNHSNYLLRADMFYQMGRFADAEADAAAAWDIDPSPINAITLAEYRGYAGDVAGGLELLDGLTGDLDIERRIAMTSAQLQAMAGDKSAAIGLLDAGLADRPNDGALLNSKCWLMGAWNFALDEILPVCTKAVELAQWAPPVLDSRAMAYLRLGQLDKAMADIESALSVAPDQTPSLLLRGLIRQAAGDVDGQKDIANALAREPSLQKRYGLLGFKVS